MAAGADPEQLFAVFLREVQEQGLDRGDLVLKRTPGGVALLTAAPAAQCQILLVAAAVLRMAREGAAAGPLAGLRVGRSFATAAVLKELLRRELPWTAADLATLAGHFSDPQVEAWIPLEALVAAAMPLRREGALPAELAAALRSIAAGIASQRATTQAQQRVAARIEEVLGVGVPLPLDPHEPWAALALEELRCAPGHVALAWQRLLEHVVGASSAKPSAKWLQTARGLVATLGEDFAGRLPGWFARATTPADPGLPMAARAIDVLRGLCWASALHPAPELQRALVPLATACSRDVPMCGPRAVRVTNACIWALGHAATPDAVGRLAVLKTRLKSRSVLKEVEKAMLAAAQQLGMGREELEELAVPTCGLVEVGRTLVALGDAQVELVVPDTGVRTALVWRNAQGKPTKSAPAAVKAQFAEVLRDLKAQQKDLERLLVAQRDRLDGLYLQPRSWSVAQFRERYLDHPVVDTLARRLIWNFTDEGAVTAALWCGDGFTTVDGSGFAPAEAAVVSLWHPLDGATASVLAWRERLQALQVVQPFKQAHREVYVLTTAEQRTAVYSNRFASHILKQHQFAALAAARGWRNQLRLLVDDVAPPAYRELPAFGLRAEFWIEGVGDSREHTTDAGTFLHVVTDQVRCYDLRVGLAMAHVAGGGYRVAADAEPLPLERIPPRVLSEVLRDVDLFVGVASVGNDPNWADQGRDQQQRAYWRDFSFGELSATAETRKQVLATVVPKLAIGPRCTFEGRFLVVRGSLRNYRIHLGSGNILMAPDDQYLCIVADGRTFDASRVYLPFEGDRTLALVLSKATLLAADEKITDPTIVRQIRGSR